MRGHWDDGVALARIREGNWDYVVLQEYSVGPTYWPEEMEYDMRLFDGEIKKVGAKTVLFSTWTRAGYDDQARMDALFDRIGRETGAMVVPVGRVWQKSLAKRMDVWLYDNDGKHPSMAGSYLTACTFYAAFYQHRLSGLPRMVTEGEGVHLALPEDQAQFLQGMAGEVLPMLTAAPATTQGSEP